MKPGFALVVLIKPVFVPFWFGSVQVKYCSLVIVMKGARAVGTCNQ